MTTGQYVMSWQSHYKLNWTGIGCCVSFYFFV